MITGKIERFRDDLIEVEILSLKSFTTAEMLDIEDTNPGMLIYNTDENTVAYSTDSAWEGVPGPSTIAFHDGFVQKPEEGRNEKELSSNIGRYQNEKVRTGVTNLNSFDDIDALLEVPNPQEGDIASLEGDQAVGYYDGFDWLGLADGFTLD